MHIHFKLLKPYFQSSFEGLNAVPETRRVSAGKLLQSELEEGKAGLSERRIEL